MSLSKEFFIQLKINFDEVFGGTSLLDMEHMIHSAGTMGFDRALLKTCKEFNVMSTYQEFEGMDWYEYDVSCSLLVDEVANALERIHES